MATAHGEGFSIEWHALTAVSAVELDRALSADLKLCQRYAAELRQESLLGGVVRPIERRKACIAHPTQGFTAFLRG